MYYLFFLESLIFVSIMLVLEDGFFFPGGGAPCVYDLQRLFYQGARNLKAYMETE